MCTAVSFKSKDHYFGRNLDLDFHYNETVTITPRNYPFVFRCLDTIPTHYAIIGMATVDQNYPLYYDATNEHGLSMAGLNFPGEAVYHAHKQDFDNVAPFELIPWVLAQCKTVKEAKDLLLKTNLCNQPYSADYPLSPLHWMVADKADSIVVEPLAEGLKIHENPIGILTNSPPFEYHLYNLRNYLNLTADMPENRFANKLQLTPYSRGMGAMGLPGDLSSASRFVRAAFVKFNSICDDDESSAVSQFFHILSSVEQQNGCCKTEHGYEKTIYSSCCNTDKGIYYFVTYDHRQIRAVDLHSVPLDSQELQSYRIDQRQIIEYIN